MKARHRCCLLARAAGFAALGLGMLYMGACFTILGGDFALLATMRNPAE